jgi:hypothetical protein
MGSLCEYEAPSNADHIRSLSDEELSEALLCPKNHDRSGILQAYCLVDVTCEECILDWLKRPYDGGKDDGQTDV